MKLYFLNFLIYNVYFSVRGACGSFLFLAINFGIVVAFAIGAYFDYHATPLFAIAVNVLFFAVFLIFPDTPVYLIKKNRIVVRFS